MAMSLFKLEEESQKSIPQKGLCRWGLENVVYSAEGSLYNQQIGVLSMTLNCIWWWNPPSGDLGRVEYVFIAITYRSTLNGICLKQGRFMAGAAHELRLMRGRWKNSWPRRHVPDRSPQARSNKLSLTETGEDLGGWPPEVKCQRNHPAWMPSGRLVYSKLEW